MEDFELGRLLGYEGINIYSGASEKRNEPPDRCKKKVEKMRGTAGGGGKEGDGKWRSSRI